MCLRLDPLQSSSTIFSISLKKTTVSENDTFIFIEFKYIADNTLNERVWEACVSYKPSVFNTSHER